MDRAGKKALPLTDDELKKVFEVVTAGKGQDEARRCLATRDRITVNRAYKVALEFRLRGVTTLDEDMAGEIAEAAKYSATAAYVRKLFLWWSGWRQGAPGKEEHVNDLVDMATIVRNNLQGSRSYDDLVADGRSSIGSIRGKDIFWPVPDPLVYIAAEEGSEIRDLLRGLEEHFPHLKQLMENRLRLWDAGHRILAKGGQHRDLEPGLRKRLDALGRIWRKQQSALMQELKEIILQHTVPPGSRCHISAPNE